MEEDYTFVPVSAITHPLFVFKDYKGEHTKFFCTLPKRNWAQYFNSEIDNSNELVEEEEGTLLMGQTKTEKSEVTETMMETTRVM